MSRESLAIYPLTPATAEHFARLNRAWIETYFWLEPLDAYVLAHPQEVIIDTGGEVWFAAWEGAIVGTYALMKVDDTRVEFTKFAVDDAMQGKGVGKALLAHAVERARALGVADMIIYSSRSLTKACAMYVAAGWVEQPMNDDDKAHYARADIKLLKPLGPTGPNL